MRDRIECDMYMCMCMCMCMCMWHVHVDVPVQHDRACYIVQSAHTSGGLPCKVYTVGVPSAEQSW